MSKLIMYLVLSLQFLCLMTQAQTKSIEIRASFELMVTYVPVRKELVKFDVKYTNSPKTNSKHYTIFVKSVTGIEFAFPNDSILLSSPLNLESIRDEFNQNLHVVDDTSRILDNNTIAEIAHNLDTIPHPIRERTIAGNLIINRYLKVFNKSNDENDHSKRQVYVQNIINESVIKRLTSENLGKIILRDTKIIDSLSKNRESKVIKIDENGKKIRNRIGVLEKEIIDKNKMKIDVSTYVKDCDILMKENELLNAKLSKYKIARDLFVSIKDPLINESTIGLVDSIDGILIKIFLVDRSKLVIGQPVDEFRDNQIKSIENDIAINEKVIKQNNTKIQKCSDNIYSTDNNNSMLDEEIKIRRKYIDDEKLKLLSNDSVSREIQTLTNSIFTLKKTKQTIDSLIKKNGNDVNSIENILDSSIVEVSKVSIQIERGFIERIQVYIPTKTRDQLNIFENIYAFGFSSIKNYKQLAKTKLFSRLTDEFIYVSDVIANFDNLLENYTRDYSPSDTTINNFKPEQGFIRLNRDQYANLFDIRVYTDLMGISDNKPNGLIQLELGRKFNILTSRHQIKSKRVDWGYLTYLNVFGSINKIENNNKYLNLRNEDIGVEGELVSPYYATNLDFRLYQNLSLGTELNGFLFDWPDAKFTGFLDFGASVGQTPLRYNIRDVTGSSVVITDKDTTLIAYSRTFYPKLTMEVFSEKRIRLSLSYQLNFSRYHSNNNFKVIASYAKSDLESRETEPYAGRSHMWEFNLSASPTSTKHDRFFLRARYFMQAKDHNTFFSQIQFGYVYNFRIKKFDL